MTYHRIALGLFALGMALTLASMVLGPFGKSDLAITGAVVASFFALAGIYFAFLSWDEPELPEKKAEEAEGTEEAEK